MAKCTKCDCILIGDENALCGFCAGEVEPVDPTLFAGSHSDVPEDEAY